MGRVQQESTVGKEGVEGLVTGSSAGWGSSWG